MQCGHARGNVERENLMSYRAILAVAAAAAFLCITLCLQTQTRAAERAGVEPVLAALMSHVAAHIVARQSEAERIEEEPIEEEPRIGEAWRIAAEPFEEAQL